MLKWKKIASFVQDIAENRDILLFENDRYFKLTVKPSPNLNDLVNLYFHYFLPSIPPPQVDATPPFVITYSTDKILTKIVFSRSLSFERTPIKGGELIIVSPPKQLGEMTLLTILRTDSRIHVRCAVQESILFVSVPFRVAVHLRFENLEK